MEQELIIGLRLLIAAVLSGIIGFERELRREPAGLRTHIIICVGATLITVISVFGFVTDPARIAAGIIVGVGFLGAGTIIASGGKLKGLTTAAGVWVVGAIGIAVGIGYYIAAIITTVIVVIVLELWRLEVKMGLRDQEEKKTKK